MRNTKGNSTKVDRQSPTVPHGALRGALSRQGFVHRALSEQNGQVLPWVVLLLFMFLGMSGLVVDVGHAMLVQRQLQASTDAAALAAAQVLPSPTYNTVALTYSAQAGQKNAYGGISVGTPIVRGKCLSTVTGWGISCSATTSTWNAVSVSETATIPSIFAEFVGIPNLTVGATSTASKGARPQPFNVAIILDTTPSMNTYDSNCGATQLKCATQAFQQLLLGLDPTMDRISLFTFPNIDSTTVGKDYDCRSSNPTVGPYTFPSTSATSLSTMPYIYTSGGRNPTTTTVQETYQVADFSTDYRTSNSSKSLNSSSNLANAVGGSSCTGMATSSNDTYYASAIYAAQASLIAEQGANPGSMNAIIFLSDGNATAQLQDGPGSSFSPGSDDMVSSSAQSGSSGTYATSSGNYPSWVGECGQGVDAANAASNYVNGSGKADGTIIYTIAYGSPATSSLGSHGGNSGNCGSDVNAGKHKNITPCQAMQQMSTGWNSSPQDTSHFFSDYYGPSADSNCQAADANNTITNLSAIVDAIVGSMSGTRLIPNNTP